MPNLKSLQISILLIIQVIFVSSLFANEIGVYKATQKVLPDMKVNSENSMHLKAAKNEWEAFQIVIKGSEDLKAVDIVTSDLDNSAKNKISSVNFSTYMEYFLETTHVSQGSLPFHERSLGSFPDPLIPLRDPYKEGNVAVAALRDIEKGKLTAFFVDLYVPQDAQAGDYTGKITVMSDGKSLKEIDLKLTVWDYEIPKEKSFGTAYQLSFNQLPKYHGTDLEGDERDKFLKTLEKRYLVTMHEHRMDPTYVKGDVEFKFDESGKLLPIDWTTHDEQVSPLLDGTMFDDGVAVNSFCPGRFRVGRGTEGMADDEYAQAADAYAKHLKEKNWLDKAYLYAVDEPWLKDTENRIKSIIKETSLILKYSDLWKDHVLVTGPYVAEIHDEVGIWCPVTPMYGENFWIDSGMYGREEYSEIFKDGKRLWFYVCNANFPPYAGYDFDTTIGYEPRIVKWGAWFEKAQGFLYWRMNYWPLDDPWNIFVNFPHFKEQMSRNGDGILLYPGNHNGSVEGKGSPEWLEIDGPIVSYRMKQIRDGLEDWELFIKAAELGAEDYTRSEVSRAYTRFGDFFLEDCNSENFYCPDNQPWTLDENVLHEVRENVAKKVQYLLNPEKYEDPEKSATVDGDADKPEDSEENANENDEEKTESEAPETDDTKDEDSGDGCQKAGNMSIIGMLFLGFALVLRRKRFLFPGTH